MPLLEQTFEYDLYCKTRTLPSQLQDYYSAATSLAQYYSWVSTVLEYLQYMLCYDCYSVTARALQHSSITTVLRYDGIGSTASTVPLLPITNYSSSIPLLYSSTTVVDYSATIKQVL
eukprot:2157232-Pyramimonas_sp.AAC.1